MVKLWRISCALGMSRNFQHITRRIKVEILNLPITHHTRPISKGKNLPLRVSLKLIELVSPRNKHAALSLENNDGRLHVFDRAIHRLAYP